MVQIITQRCDGGEKGKLCKQLEVNRLLREKSAQ
jgi:hypothetical protein